MDSTIIASLVQKNQAIIDGLPVGSAQDYSYPSLTETWDSFNFSKFLQSMVDSPPPRPRGLVFFKLD